jgi:two-component system, cell cycle sensor histidine kinase and response regulator CckA
VKRFLRRIFTKHAGTILIAEPDRELRQLQYRALSINYRIVRTSSVVEAVRTAARHAPEIDLLLTEVGLPDGFGWHLTELLKLDYPRLKVIYLSSFIDAEIRAHTRRSVVVLVEKPFRSDRLREAVREVLENRNHIPLVA